MGMDAAWWERLLRDAIDQRNVHATRPGSTLPITLYPEGLIARTAREAAACGTPLGAIDVMEAVMAGQEARE